MDARTADDAAVYRLDGDRALVLTADFFTPIVDDPVDFGRIAAANALSDVYAMGARPLVALNLVAFPRALLGEGLLEGIIEGGASMAREAGVPVVGGHSIDDPEPKYGLCVVGEVHPERVVRNSTARSGDVLVLTKPVGTGVIATALKAGAAPPDVVERAVDLALTRRCHVDVCENADLDVCWRARVAGWRVVMTPLARVRHRALRRRPHPISHPAS